jgi:hypothetical protein
MRRAFESVCMAGQLQKVGVGSSSGISRPLKT